MYTTANHAVVGGSDASQPANAPHVSSPSLSPSLSPSRLHGEPSNASINVSDQLPTDSSPSNSRDTSPSRRLTRSASINNTPSKPNKSSTHEETSPSRITKAAPTPGSSSTRISAATTPKLGPVSTASPTRVSAPQKSPITAEHLKETPRWPVSPRLRSPPPTSARPNLPPPRKPELETPAIHVQHSSPPIQQQSEFAATAAAESHLQPGMRTPARGPSGGNSSTTLETVEEASPMASPQQMDNIMDRMDDGGVSESGSQIDLLEFSTTPKAIQPLVPASNHDSGSDSGSVQGDRRTASTNVPPILASRQSNASVKTSNTVKAKPSEGSVQHMTVETETVTSIPQVSLAPTGAKEGANSTLRAKPSTETIRPKKEKKKTGRKPNVGSGTASSKADIFEAKIASAVDEHDSSDSEETFVYDSNPPDVSDRPRRYHSRTPSATSMASQVDRNGMRSISNFMDNNGGPSAVKRNMKFVTNNNNNNTFNSSGNESVMADEEYKGTVRTAPGSGRGTSRMHHHHYGRWGRNSTNGHTSLFDSDAPFHVGSTTTQRSKFSTTNSRQSSGPPSPRFLNASRMAATMSKRGVHSAGYDLDETTGADDESTPLLHGSVRSSRSGRTRRQQPMSMRSLESQSYRRNPSILNRFASCLVLTVMLLLVVSGAIGFMFATSQPLVDVELKSINTVIASQTELMFDLSVKAHNPNVVVVVVDQADIEVFAKSPHAGTDSEYHDASRKDHGQNPDGTWGDNDPVNDKAPNMRLGTISHLDSPLSFEGSFFNQGISASTGEVRLLKPGNGTIGGAERWEKILQDEFDLIIKGVLKYTLPLSQRVRSVTISGRTTVKPNAADNPDLQPNKTEIVMQARD